MAQAMQKQPPTQAPQQQSLAATKVASMLSQAQKNEKLWNGLLVALGAFMLLSAVPFYPIYVVILIAAACGAVAYFAPPFGLIAGVVLGVPAVMYQSSIFAWFYLLIVVLVLFEAFEQWMVVATLEVLILAPFVFGGFPLIGWITILGMAMSALYFGSKKSVAISLSAVTLILLFSSIQLVQNTAYMPIKTGLYVQNNADLKFSRPAAELGTIGTELGDAVGRLFDSLGKIWDSL